MGPGPTLRACFLASFLLLVCSQAAAVFGLGGGWSPVPLLYGLVPSLGLALVAERLPLRTHHRAAGLLSLAASAFAGLYAWLEGGFGAGAPALRIPMVLGFAGALPLLAAGLLALAVRPAPARTFRPAAAPEAPAEPRGPPQRR